MDEILNFIFPPDLTHPPPLLAGISSKVEKSSSKFTTEMSTKEHTLKWKIKNFTKLHETKSPTNGKTCIRFRVGINLKQSSSWRLELGFKTGNDMSFHLYRLYPEESPAKPISARFDWSILDKNRCPLISLNRYTPLYTFATEDRTGRGYANFETLDRLRTVGALADDTLRIWFKIEVYDGETVSEGLYGLPVVKNNKTLKCAQEILKQNSLNEMNKNVGDLLKTGNGSDCVIRVKIFGSGEYFEKRVHRNILSVRSPVFDAMFESPMSEKETGIVTIRDLSPKGLNILLEYIYTGNLSNDWKLVPEEVLNAAEKYQIPLLKNYIAKWLHTACTPENASNLYNLAKQHNLSKALQNISVYIKANLDNVLCK